MALHSETSALSPLPEDWGVLTCMREKPCIAVKPIRMLVICPLPLSESWHQVLQWMTGSPWSLFAINDVFGYKLLPSFACVHIRYFRTLDLLLK